VKPNLAPGVTIDANLILKLSGQGSVYIRSLEPLLEDQDYDAMEEDCFDACISPSSRTSETAQVVNSDPLPIRTIFDQVASGPSVLSSEPLPENERETFVPEHLFEVETTTVFTSEPVTVPVSEPETVPILYDNSCSAVIAGVHTASSNLDANIVTGNININFSL
jgi:hypothetical protein